MTLYIHCTLTLFIPIKFRYLIITTVHDAREIVDIPLLKTHEESTIYKMIIHNIRMHALKLEFIISVSSRTKEEMANLGYPKNKISVVNLGINKNFLIDKLTAKTSKHKKFNIGHAGSFARNKNIDFILDTSKILSKNPVNFYLW